MVVEVGCEGSNREIWNTGWIFTFEGRSSL
jgi:hypothetical protein